MSTLDDLIAQLHVVREQINDSLGHLAGLKSATEEVLGTYEAVGAEGMAAQAAQIVDDVEGSEATTQSTVPQIEAVIAQAEALKTGGQAGASGGVSLTFSDVATGADATAIPSIKWRNEVGQPLEAPEDLEEPRDVSKSKSRRALNTFSRNSSGIKKQSEESANAAFNASGQAYKPPPGQTYETVRHDPYPSAGPVQSPQVSGEDAVGSLVIVFAVVVDGLNRFRARRKGKE